MKIIFVKLRAAGLKVDASKFSFWLKDITYLSCVITREGLKSDPKKVKGIIKLGQLTTTTEVQGLIGMVQSYRDVWTRCSHILAPLIKASIGPKGRYCVMTL